MHRLRPPGEDSFSDQYASAPEYTDVVGIVRTYLEDRVQAAVARGVREDAVVIDPGLGFGKSVEQNLELIRRTAELCSIGRAVMSAASRKSFIGRVGLGRESEPAERLGGSVAVTVMPALAGAQLFRVHDVAAHAQALRLTGAIRGDMP